ncbi:MAG TPA: protein kinase [Bacteroidota bacterium]|nr:protein kinase [Bacteroidota bacterium]
MVGKTILNYRILEKLGEGGMGVVYKAMDLALGQTVAVRFLPLQLSHSEVDRARSILEARAASTFTHPNICTVHAIKEHEGQMFIVMDYVEGETLRKKLTAGPVQVRRSIEIGMQIAEGLAILHDHGMIHRNIKPENIMIRKDGVVQVMDFGLLRRGTLSPEAREGCPVGTAAYMSPEIIQGHASDQRTDIFSLGVILYEILSGQPPFRGADEAALMSDILGSEPRPLSTFVEGIDKALDDVVLECLVKDQEERYQSARELAKDLRRYARTAGASGAERMVKVSIKKYPPGPPQEPGSFTASVIKFAGFPRGSGEEVQVVKPGGAAAPAATVPPLAAFKGALPWAFVLAFLAAAVSFLLLYFRGPVSETRSVRSFIRPPENSTFARVSGGANGGHFALAPDGKRLTFAATDSTGVTRLWVRPLNALQCAPLAGTDEASYPFWSADSRYIGFFSGGKLRKIDASGGAVTTICEASSGRGGSWSSADVIVFAPSPTEPLSQVPASGGTPVPVTKLDASRLEHSHRWPCFLPDGKHFLYLARGSSTDIVYVGSLDGKENKELTRKHSNVLYGNSCLLFIEEGSLIAQPFDPSGLEMKGLPSTVAEGVKYDPGYGRGEFSVSGHGELLYAEGGSENSGLAWFDRAGSFNGYVARSVKNVDARISPDGNRVAYSSDAEEGANRRLTTDLWLYDRVRGLTSRLTFDPGDEIDPVWSPDGRQIAFSSNRSGRANPYRINADATAGEQPLMGSDYNFFPTDWSADGKYIALQRGPTKDERWSIWILPLAAGKKPYSWVKSDADLQLGKFSPDGRWMAYVSDESGEQQVYIRPFPGPGSRTQVSLHGCNGEAFWRRDGKELYFMSLDSRVIAAELARAGSSLKVTRLRESFDARSRGIRFLRGITPDSQRLLGVYNPSDTRPADLTLVTDWIGDTRKP